MRWYRNLYLSREVEAQASSIRREMDGGVFRRGVWVLTLCANGTDYLDIRRASTLSAAEEEGDGTHFAASAPGPAGVRSREEEVCILGLAASRREAIALAQEMARDCLLDTGDADLRSWFTRRLEERTEQGRADSGAGEEGEIR